MKPTPVRPLLLLPLSYIMTGVERRQTPGEAEYQEREENGLQPTQVPSSPQTGIAQRQQVRFNGFFSPRLRTLSLSTGMEGRATEWQLPPPPQHGQGKRDGKTLNCLDPGALSEKAAKKV